MSTVFAGAPVYASENNDLEARMPRYYVKPIAGSRNNTVTLVSDAHLNSIPLEIGSFEIELVGLFTLTTTGTQGIKTQWGFTGTANGTTANRVCIGPGDSASNPNVNATIMAQAYQATGQAASYFRAPTAAYSGFREIVGNFIVTAAGNLSLAWAQSVLSANNTTLQEGTYFRVTRYA